MLIQEFQVLLYICSKLFYVVENLPEAFFHMGQHLRKLDVAKTRNHIVGHGVVLIAEEDREFVICVTSLCISLDHQLFWLLGFGRLCEFQLPVDEAALQQKVQANHVLAHQVLLVFCVCMDRGNKLINLQDLGGQLEQPLSLYNVEQEILPVNELQNANVIYLWSGDLIYKSTKMLWHLHLRSPWLFMSAMIPWLRWIHSVR